MPTLVSLELHDSLIVSDEFALGTWNKAPLRWRILSLAGTRALAICTTTLDAVPFHETLQPADWAHSSVRAWLAETFEPAAFSEEEIGLIVCRESETPGSPEYGTEGCEMTSDRTFCLSLEEAQAYFGSDEARSSDGDNPCWWLRSPGGLPDYAAYVHHNGWINAFGYNVDTKNVCVRPALAIDIAALVPEAARGLQTVLASEYGADLMMEALETDDFSDAYRFLAHFGVDESFETLIVEKLESLARKGDAGGIEELLSCAGDVEFASGALACAFEAGNATVARMLLRKGYSLDCRTRDVRLVNDTPGLRRVRRASWTASAGALAEQAIRGSGSESVLKLLVRQDALPGTEYRLIAQAAAAREETHDLFAWLLNPDYDELAGVGARWHNRKIMIVSRPAKHDLPVSEKALRLLWHAGLRKSDPLSVKAMAPYLADPAIHDRQALLDAMIEGGWAAELEYLLGTKRMFTPHMLANGVQLARTCGKREIERMLRELLKSVGAGKLLQDL